MLLTGVRRADPGPGGSVDDGDADCVRVSK